MPGKIIMVTGGARSGKSEFAERYVLHYSPKCDYVATAEILDEEMAERVRLHRERRDARWINHEAPYHAERTLEALSAETGAVLFDCLTVYMCNLLYGKDAPEGEFLERCQVVFDEIDTGISGKAANAVAKKLKAIAKEHQVMCISHLPNIAANADHNYFISKDVNNNLSLIHI